MASDLFDGDARVAAFLEPDSPSRQKALRDAFHERRLKERASIVAWLRAQNCDCDVCQRDGNPHHEADAIERGEHTPAGEKKEGKT